MSAIDRVAPRVPPRLWARLDAWLGAFERERGDGELVIVLNIKNGRVTRGRVRPPEEVVGWCPAGGEHPTATGDGA